MSHETPQSERPPRRLEPNNLASDPWNENVTWEDGLSARQMRWEAIFHFGLMLLALAVITMSFLMRSVGESLVFLPGAALPMPESCTAKKFFGISCPGCGLTRSFISISSGQWARAWHFNPAGFIVYLFIAGQIPWRLFQIGRILTGRMPLFSVWLFLPLIVVVCSLLLQWIVRLVL